MALSLEEQYRRIKKKYPEAWESLTARDNYDLPQYDDNDELITEKKGRKKK